MIEELIKEPEFLYETGIAFTPGVRTTAASETCSTTCYRLPFGMLKIKYSSEDWIEPDWFLPTLGVLRDLHGLNSNWDSYGAMKVDIKSLEATLLFLVQFLPVNAPIPAIIPIPTGNIQVEWHQGGVDLEIGIHPHGIHDYYFCDIQNNIEVEDIFIGNFSPLCEYIETLVQCS